MAEAKKDFEVAQKLEPSKVTQEKVRVLECFSDHQLLSIKKIDQLLERGKELTEKQDWEPAESIYQVECCESYLQ